MQPTAARSPTLNFFTPAPTFTTRPVISWPGTHGYIVGQTAHSLRAVCRSLWHTPQNRISISTSPGPTSRRGMLVAAREVDGPVAANARVVDMVVPRVPRG